MKMTDDLFNYCHKHNDELYVYGAGNLGKRLQHFLQQHNMKVRGFIETKKSKNLFHGIPIYALKELSLKNNPGILIGVSDKYRDEILNELKKLDYNDGFIVSNEIHEHIRAKVNYRDFLKREKKSKVQVLLFHRVTYKDYDPWQLEVKPERFDEYIRYIAENFPVVKFEDDWSKIRDRSLCITFDDGYWDNYEYALPILEKYRIPATIFICTGNIDTKKEFWWDRLTRIIPEDEVPSTRDRLKILPSIERESILDDMEIHSTHSRPLKDGGGERTVNTDELKQMVDSEYISIGAHTVTHTALAYETKEEQYFEISHSKLTLEQLTGREVNTFSYPFGGLGTYSTDSIQIVKECGFLKAASNFPGIVDANTDPYQIPRYAQPERDLCDFAKKIEEAWYLDDK